MYHFIYPSESWNLGCFMFLSKFVLRFFLFLSKINHFTHSYKSLDLQLKFHFSGRLLTDGMTAIILAVPLLIKYLVTGKLKGWLERVTAYMIQQ